MASHLVLYIQFITSFAFDHILRSILRHSGSVWPCFKS